MTTDQRTTRAIGVVTAVSGAVMVLRPAAVIAAVTGSGSAPHASIVRVLGGRYLLQGAALVSRPVAATLWIASLVDTAHGASMVAAAQIRPAYRRAAFSSAAVAGVSALVTASVARKSQA